MFLQIYDGYYDTLKDVDEVSEISINIKEINEKFTSDTPEYYDELFAYIRLKRRINVNGYSLLIDNDDSIINHNNISILITYLNGNIRNYVLVNSAYILNNNGKTIRKLGH